MRLAVRNPFCARYVTPLPPTFVTPFPHSIKRLLNSILLVPVPALLTDMVMRQDRVLERELVRWL
jgi:hypothetical protein